MALCARKPTACAKTLRPWGCRPTSKTPRTMRLWAAEVARRAARLATIEAARRRLEARAKADAEAERQRRAEVEAARQRLGSPRRGKAPPPGDEAPDDKAQ